MRGERGLLVNHLVPYRKLELPFMLGTTQRKSLSLWLPSLRAQVTECDLLLERLKQSPLQTRLSPHSHISDRPTVRKTGGHRGWGHEE